jgi:hypothetical protein
MQMKGSNRLSPEAVKQRRQHAQFSQRHNAERTRFSPSLQPRS